MIEDITSNQIDNIIDKLLIMQEDENLTGQQFWLINDVVQILCQFLE